MNALLIDDRAGQCLDRFTFVRGRTVALCANLSPEDLQIQSMPDASPGKWHLAHTTWFFEHFVLGSVPGYQTKHPEWHYLFNSYYASVGPMHARPHRGLITRPSATQVLDYRKRVDAAIQELLSRHPSGDQLARVELGTHHEQQHQELLLTDIKHAFSCNPLQPAFNEGAFVEHQHEAPKLRFVPGAEGVVEIGHGSESFAFDNELPRHRTWLSPHALANRMITNAEYLAFVRDGGYREEVLWLSDGWATVQREGWERPLYWQQDLQSEFTMAGVRALELNAPVCHLSYFEADAFARWAGARLPTEAEWEHAAASIPLVGHFQESNAFRPRTAHAEDGLLQMYGDLWEWTTSPYVGYPGFKTLSGALGEYNGKFMNGQWVLRGGSCATPISHMRTSYRNFFPPHARWQFAGIRLGQDR